MFVVFFLMIRRPPRSTRVRSSAASDVYKRQVLKGLDLQVERGEWVACTGRSGSGKSTLLNVLGLLDSADGGRYLIAGQDVSQLDDAGRAGMRNQLLGFVFQLHNLLP